MLDLEYLKDSPVFKGFTSEQFEMLSYVVGDVAIPKGHLLFKEGALARSMFILRDGEIELFQEAGGAVFASLGEGDIFGEMAVIRDLPRSCSARAASNSSLWTISQEKLDTLRHQAPALWGSLMFNVAGILADRLAAVQAKLHSDGGPVSNKVEERGFLGRLLGH